MGEILLPEYCIGSTCTGKIGILLSSKGCGGRMGIGGPFETIGASKSIGAGIADEGVCGRGIEYIRGILDSSINGN